MIILLSLQQYYYCVIIFAVASELEQLFVKQSSLEVYFEWLDSLIERRVAEVG
jgi:hypothetical protein